MATANQIAYAAAQEQARHNQVVEEETQRSNKENERLKAWELDIEDRYRQNEYLYKQESNRLQDEYNSLWAQAQKASLDEKTWYDERMTEVQKQLADAQSDKVRNDYLIRQDEIALGYSKADEEKRHNEEVERLERSAQALQNKKLEFDKYEFNASFILDIQGLQLKRKQFEEQQFINRLDYTTRQQSISIERREAAVKEGELRLQEELLPYQQSESKSRAKLNKVKAFTEPYNSVTNSFNDLVDSVTPF